MSTVVFIAFFLAEMAVLASLINRRSEWLYWVALGLLTTTAVLDFLAGSHPLPLPLVFSLLTLTWLLLPAVPTPNDERK